MSYYQPTEKKYNMKKIYKIKRIGRDSIQKLNSALDIGDLTNYPIKGQTLPMGKDEFGEKWYKVIKRNT